VGSAPRSDLAVLQIDVRGTPLPEVGMGRSDDLMIGETVIAIGNPFGLSHTVTTGVISAIDRTVRSENQIYRRFIQTDASINPGNSGGPLLNIRGELIGINTAIYQKAQGIGFAIPIDKAKRIVRELLVAGEVRLPWLGLELQELDPKLRAYFNFLDENTGIVLSNVIQGGPGERAGLKRGDILMNIDGIPISSEEEYKGALSEFTPSDPITLRIFRTGKTLSIVVQPAVFPLALALDLVFRRLGIQLGEVDEATQSKYRLAGRVIVEKVTSGSEAHRMGLERGDLLLKINESSIKILEDAKKAISRYRHLTSLTLIIQRGPYAYSLTLPFY
jgi:S1-C subfamily serine protease